MPNHRLSGIGIILMRRVTDSTVRNNWIELDGTKITRVENGTEIQIPPENIAMFHPLTKKDFPEGDIHLLGDKW